MDSSEGEDDGRKKLLDRRMSEMKRFDSADFFRRGDTSERDSYLKDVGNRPDGRNNNWSPEVFKEVKTNHKSKEVSTGDNWSPVRNELSIVEQKLTDEEGNKSPSTMLAERCLRQRKRWDSADYNVILNTAQTPKKQDKKPQLDALKDVQTNYKPPAIPRGKQSTAQPHMVAALHMQRTRRKVKRFDSADYFRGMSPPSNECDMSPIPVSPRAPPGKTTLGASTIALRDLKAAKLRLEKQNCI